MVRIALKFLGILFVIYLLALFAVNSFDISQYKNKIAQEFTNFTDLHLDIGGPIGFTTDLLFNPKVTLHDLKIKGPNKQDNFLLQVDKAILNFNIISIFFNNNICLKGNANKITVNNVILKRNDFIFNYKIQEKIDFTFQAKEFASGSVNFNLFGKLENKLWHYNSNLYAGHFMLDEILNSDKKWFSGGKSALQAIIKTNGNNKEELLNHLNGNMILQVGSGTITSESNINNPNVIYKMLDEISRDVRDKNLINFSCAVANFIIKQGTGFTQDGIAINTDMFALLGSGNVNLHNNKLALHFSLIPHNNLIIKAMDLKNLISVSGTIWEPKLQIKPHSLIKQAKSVISAFATAGFSGILGTLKSTENEPTVNNIDVCKTALNYK